MLSCNNRVLNNNHLLSFQSGSFLNININRKLLSDEISTDLTESPDHKLLFVPAFEIPFENNQTWLNYTWLTERLLNLNIKTFFHFHRALLVGNFFIALLWMLQLQQTARHLC